MSGLEDSLLIFKRIQEDQRGRLRTVTDDDEREVSRINSDLNYSLFTLAKRTTSVT
jgi:hypothetical protein